MSGFGAEPHVKISLFRIYRRRCRLGRLLNPFFYPSFCRRFSRQSQSIVTIRLNLRVELKAHFAKRGAVSMFIKR